MCQQDNGSSNWALLVGAGSSRFFNSTIYYNGGWYTASNIDTELDTWCNLTFTWNGSEMRSYLNGVLQKITLMNGAYSEQNGSQYFIGGIWNSGADFEGEIGEIRIYNGDLDAAAVAEIYNTTVATYPNTTAPTEMKIRFTASTYSGSGEWANTGTLGTTHNAVINQGTPVKNTSGNGVVFNRNLVFRFPNFGSIAKYTQSIWFKRTGMARTIMCQQDNGSSNWALLVGAGSSRFFNSTIYYNGGWYTASNIETDVDVWYNITFTWNGSEMRSYLNGVLQKISLMSGAYSEQNGSQYFIGGIWNSGADFEGEIGEIRIYNGDLDAAAVANIYSTTQSLYPNPTPVTEMKIRFTGTNYSGSGAWTNMGTLGVTHNAVINSGSASKSGNGVVFNGGLVFRFPNIGPLARYTQSLWFKRTGNLNSIMVQQNNGSSNWALFVNGNGSNGVRGVMYYNGGWYDGPLQTVNQNVWYNLTIVWDGSRMITYMNGALQTITTMNGVNSEQNGSQYFIGANWDGGATFVGHIGEIRVYNGVLSSTEITQIYTDGVSTYV